MTLQFCRTNTYFINARMVIFSFHDIAFRFRQLELSHVLIVSIDFYSNSHFSTPKFNDNISEDIYFVLLFMKFHHAIRIYDPRREKYCWHSGIIVAVAQ